MKNDLPDNLSDRIMDGIRLAVKKVYENARKNDEEVVFMRDGKIVKMKARDMKEE